MSMWFCYKHGVTNSQCCSKASTSFIEDLEIDEDETKENFNNLTKAYEMTHISRNNVFK